MFCDGSREAEPPWMAVLSWMDLDWQLSSNVGASPVGMSESLIDTSVARSGMICVDDAVAVVGLIGTGCTRGVFANASAGWIGLARTGKGTLVSALSAVVVLAGIGSMLA